jgi:hypothetical protein
MQALIDGAARRRGVSPPIQLVVPIAAGREFIFTPPVCFAWFMVHSECKFKFILCMVYGSF